MISAIAKCGHPSNKGLVYTNLVTGARACACLEGHLPETNAHEAWFAFACDNLRDAQIPIELLEMAKRTFIIRVNDSDAARSEPINVFCPDVDATKSYKSGCYKSFGWAPMGKGIYMRLKRVGDMDPTKLVYTARAKIEDS